MCVYRHNSSQAVTVTSPQKQQPGAFCFDQLFGPFAFMKADIVEDDDIARRHGRASCVSIQVSKMRLFMGALTIHGATIASDRRPAMKASSRRRKAHGCGNAAPSWTIPHAWSASCWWTSHR